MKVYKLQIRYEVTSYERPEREGGYDQMTGERLSIDDTFDIADAMSLTKLLSLIDAMHDSIKPHLVAKSAQEATT